MRSSLDNQETKPQGLPHAGTTLAANREAAEPFDLVGKPFVDVTASGGSTEDKLEVRGSIVEVARSYLLASRQQPVLRPIIGPEDVGTLATKLLSREFQNVKPSKVARATAVSVRVKETDGVSRPRIRTNPLIDRKSFLESVEPDQSNFAYLGMSAEDNPLLLDLLDQIPHKRQHWLNVSRSQSGNPATTLPIMSRTSNHVYIHDAARLTGCRYAIDAICAMREAGVASVVVSDTKRGLVAFHDGEWHSVPPHDIPTAKNVPVVQIGNAVVGTLIASQVAELGFGDGLRLANAAMAMLLAGVSRHGGWEELRQFREVTPYRQQILPIMGTFESKLRASLKRLSSVFSLAMPFAAK